MAKIGTAQIEIKPVLNEEALDAIVQRIADAVAAGVERGMAKQAVGNANLPIIYPASPPPCGSARRQNTI